MLCEMSTKSMQSLRLPKRLSAMLLPTGQFRFLSSFQMCTKQRAWKSHHVSVRLKNQLQLAHKGTSYSCMKLSHPCTLHTPVVQPLAPSEAGLQTSGSGAGTEAAPRATALPLSFGFQFSNADHRGWGLSGILGFESLKFEVWSPTSESI